MMIQSLPPAPSLEDDVATFDSKAFPFAAALSTFATEANALAGGLNATSGAGAIAIPYTFSTTTTDSDPGSGNLRLNQATQNTATVIRTDLTGSDGINYTTVLDMMDDSTGSPKGYIRIVKSDDATKFLVFSVTSLAIPSGYRNITVTNIFSSSASPFASGDAVTLYFTRTGDLQVPSVGDHCVYVSTGNGYGSTNTKIRRYTTSLINAGTSITYADSAANGASFTVNDAGIYSMTLSDLNGSAASDTGISINSTQLTSSIAAITAADRLAYLSIAAGVPNSVSVTRRLAAADVIRVHGGGTLPNASGTNPESAWFVITKIAV